MKSTCQCTPSPSSRSTTSSRHNIIAKGYDTPTPIQDQTIPVALEGYDVIGIANTGTGKTAAFALPMLHQLMNFADSRALIVAPTRELAQQIEQECRIIAKGSGLTGALLIGGSAMGPQLRDLRASHVSSSVHLVASRITSARVR